MNRKKFVTLFSTSVLGAALIKANLLNLFNSKRTPEATGHVKIKLNLDAVRRENSGKKNG
jgi:hypothetical protein